MLISFYSQPMLYIVLEILLIPILWAFVSFLISRNCWIDSLLRVLILLSVTWGITSLTIFNRITDLRSELVKFPFQLVVEAIREDREIIRSLLLNVILFCPFGAAVSDLLPQRKTIISRVIMACSIGLVMSLLIEWAQYRLYLGNAEADDVICNTLGTFIGALSLPIKTAIAAVRNIEKER